MSSIIHPARHALSRWATRGAALAGLLCTGPVMASVVSGTFVDDDERAVQLIDEHNPFRLHVHTTSWANGGFAPVLSLFDLGSGLLLGVDAGSSHGCPNPAPGASAFCWDAWLDTTLLAGSYALVLSQDGNAPTGDLTPGQPLDDVFPQTGQHDYTGMAYLGTPNLRFINVDLTQRTGAWSMDIQIEPMRQVPEPASIAIVLAALAAIGLGRMGRRSPT